ncbi:MAG TPA: hypothetical protein VMF29_06065, partial [Candidatus Edwardsbacteria bacterium]|nr:hypothetical protein [Candidatus Edwardsbacteria bacterium]
AAYATESSQRLVAQLKEKIALAKERVASAKPAPPAVAAPVLAEQPQPAEYAPEPGPEEDFEQATAAEVGDGVSSDEVLMEQEPAAGSTPTEDAFISDKDQGLSFL